jgi:plasmid maintenance system antidote protein VapI
MDTIPFAFSIHPGEILLIEFMQPLASQPIVSPKISISPRRG